MRIDHLAMPILTRPRMLEQKDRKKRQKCKLTCSRGMWASAGGWGRVPPDETVQRRSRGASFRALDVCARDCYAGAMAATGERAILVLNAGSSTFKWSLFDPSGTPRVRAGGTVHWEEGGHPGEQLRRALERVTAVGAVGHRVVHGGARFRDAVRIDDDVRRAIGELVAVDPLHQSVAVAGIDVARALYPDAVQVAAFDTAFHSTIPDASRRYGIPARWTERFELYRYGFHGLSVAYAVRRVAALLGASPGRLLVCHLGGGSSITAVRDGRSVDTTMGFTALDGVLMATRPGALDPGILLRLLSEPGITAAELQAVLWQRSGLLGVSGVSGDLRQVMEAMDRGHRSATLAYEMLVESLVRGAGAMIAVLGGVDAIVFTGGIGEHAPRVRADLLARLGFLGVATDPEANARCAGAEGEIARPESRVRVVVIAAREDEMILEAVRRLASGAVGR